MRGGCITPFGMGDEGMGNFGCVYVRLEFLEIELVFDRVTGG